MEDYRYYLEEGVNASFSSAIETIKKISGIGAAAIVEKHVIEALLIYKEAAYMQGYFTALGDLYAEYRSIFYTAATNMIHFKHYHVLEER